MPKLSATDPAPIYTRADPATRLTQTHERRPRRRHESETNLEVFSIRRLQLLLVSMRGRNSIGP
jgi:hypothetical protein